MKDDAFAEPPVSLLPDPLPLARQQIDRDTTTRFADDFLARVLADESTLTVLVSGTSLLTSGKALALIPAPQVVDEARRADEWFYLGKDETHRFVALVVHDDDRLAAHLDNLAIDCIPAQHMLSLRDSGHLLSDVESGLATTAVALAQWRSRNRCCPTCGVGTKLVESGWASSCPNGHLGYPRTDPAAIMAVHDGDGRLLLAHSANWPRHRRSVLAGFVEAGEDPATTVRREVLEEVGLKVGAVQYVGSQPWPFPGSLMLGYHAWVEGDTKLQPDGTEITAADWYTRDELRAAITTGDVMLPMQTSIARCLIESWYGDTLP